LFQQSGGRRHLGGRNRWTNDRYSGRGICGISTASGTEAAGIARADAEFAMAVIGCTTTVVSSIMGEDIAVLSAVVGSERSLANDCGTFALGGARHLWYSY